MAHHPPEKSFISFFKSQIVFLPLLNNPLTKLAILNEDLCSIQTQKFLLFSVIVEKRKLEVKQKRVLEERTKKLAVHPPEKSFISFFIKVK